MADQDRELEAMQTVIAALSELDDEERSRVLEYVLKRLEIAAVTAPVQTRSTPDVQESSRPRAITDIRSLKEEKNPQSAMDMAVLAAYYLSELAPQHERSDTINADAIRRYFKMAGFRLPAMLKNVLPNAASAGYLENVSRGEYRLNPVGYNLVVHGMPRTGQVARASDKKMRGRRKHASKTANRTKKATATERTRKKKPR
jgi:hypothetical protein